MNHHMTDQDQADRILLETAHGMAEDWSRTGMDGDTDTVALFLDAAFRYARAILSGDLDDRTVQDFLSKADQITDSLDTDLFDARETDVPR